MTLLTIGVVRAWLLARTGLDDIEADRPIFSSGLLDSFDLIELVAVIETQANRRLPAIDINARAFDTLKRIEAYIGAFEQQ